jgi:hypothetical protein
MPFNTPLTFNTPTPATALTEGIAELESIQTGYVQPPDHIVTMCRELFATATAMMSQCAQLDHTNYKDADSYSKDFEMRWTKAVALIDQVHKMMGTK